MKYFCITKGATPIAFLLVTIAMLTAQKPLEPVGVFDHHQDIGNPSLPGSATYDRETQTYRLSASGENMWAEQDQFHFAWTKIKGNFILSCTVQFLGKGVHEHRKLGIIARDGLSADSRYADACVHGDTLSSLQYRAEKGGGTDQVVLPVYHPTELVLERKGDHFIYSAAVFGSDYKSVRVEQPLNETAYVGLFLCSHDADVVEEALFSNVRIVIPASEDFRPYRDYIGSHLEIMHVATGHRRILHSENRSLQAPNWTRDNQRLIYNAEGLLYNFNLEDGSIDVLNTGPADQNNNDHVLSFDGRQLAISHHLGKARTSTIYTLPVEGSSTPKRISDPEKGHAYLHSWSPDDRQIIFTGQRNDQWNIWSIDVEFGEEKNLTNHPALDDGSEYTPDGRWIYFNSVRTGTMQIWRMRPDGSGQEQVTFDVYNNWFPHISPNGKWICYLAYPESVNPVDHPFYKRVKLKLMPAGGGTARTIAYVYGGQGTINVPSWSPDSQYIAFVSNSRM